MKILNASDRLSEAASAVSVGMFDGVHRGHRRLLQILGETAQGAGLPSVVVTFDPHPRAVLQPNAAPRMLCTLADRLALLASVKSVDYCLVVRFDKTTAECSAETFVQDTLLARLGLRHLVVGENFCCGKRRQGDVGFLAELGMRHGFGVQALALHGDEGSNATEPAQRYSSTATRRVIESGNVAAAAQMLERPHELTGILLEPASHDKSTLEIELPQGMCAPAADYYAGAARNNRALPRWVPALLQVRHVPDARDAQQRRVRLTMQTAFDALPGDLVSVRFLERC